MDVQMSPMAIAAGARFASGILPNIFSREIVSNKMICYRTILHGINYGGYP